MSETRKTLIESFKDSVEFYKNRKTVGRMKTEHVIFIPVELMKGSSSETSELILLAKDINKQEELGCPVEPEGKTEGLVKGLEIVFSFSKNTDFDGIINLIDQRINKA